MGPETKTDFLRLLGLAKRAGRAELGEDGVSGAAADGKARVVFLAVDAAKNSVRRARNATASGLSLIHIYPSHKRHSAPFKTHSLRGAPCGRPAFLRRAV